MPYKKTPHIKSIIHQNSSLNPLIDYTKQLAIINKIVLRTLPHPLNTHCEVANYRENALYLHVDSPAWATRLRFSIPEIINELKKHKETNNLREIKIHQVKLETPAHEIKPKGPTRARLSVETAEQLNCLADSVTDQKLAAALRRLAQRNS